MGTVNTSNLTSLITTHLVSTEKSKVDSRRLTLVKQFHEQVVQITRVVVGEQSNDDINIAEKFTLHSDNI